jgi:phage head maturation protease
MAKAKDSEAEPTAIELERAEQARVEEAIGTVTRIPMSTRVDPQQARVEAALAALHRGDEDPQAAADALDEPIAHRSGRWRRSETVASVRRADPASRDIVGLAVPYGAISNQTDLDGRGAIGRETVAPGAGRDSVAFWMTRQDGARMPYRSRHGDRPVGAVTQLEDRADGVGFRASIFPGQAGDDYLAEVDAGLNGVSAEYAPSATTRGRDGLVVARTIKLFAIAGSDAPAYDGARIALRDMEDSMNCEHCGAAMTAGVAHTCASAPANRDTAPTPAAPAAPAPAAPAPDTMPPLTLSQRSMLEAAGLTALIPNRSQAVVTRPEAVYSPRGEFNYLADTWSAARGNSDARERQERHRSHLADVAIVMEREAAARFLDPAYAERAGDLLSSEIPGAYPNDYLPGLLTPRIFKGRPMGDFYTRFPIADGRPRIFAKVTTSGVVVVQSAEGAALGTTDIATTAVTVNPVIYGATIDVSRQVLDGADPAALSIVYQDLLEAYAQASETAIKTAVEAGSTASGVAITAATPYIGTLQNVINYYAVRFRGATGAFIPSALFPVLAAQGDTTGRPFLPMIGAVNSDGSTLSDDTSLALAVLSARTALSYASTVNVCVFGRPSDFVVMESPIATVQYDQVVGPQAVRVGLYAYLGIGTRLGSLKVTAA